MITAVFYHGFDLRATELTKCSFFANLSSCCLRVERGLHLYDEHSFQPIGVLLAKKMTNEPRIVRTITWSNVIESEEPRESEQQIPSDKQPLQQRPVRAAKTSSARATIGDQFGTELSQLKPRFANAAQREQFEDEQYMLQAIRVGSHRIVPVRTIEEDEVVAVIAPKGGEPVFYVRPREIEYVPTSRKGRAKLIREQGYRDVFEAGGAVHGKHGKTVVHCTKDGVIKEKEIQPSVDIVWFQSAEIPEYKRREIPVIEPSEQNQPSEIDPAAEWEGYGRRLAWLVSRIASNSCELIPDDEEPKMVEESAEMFMVFGPKYLRRWFLAVTAPQPTSVVPETIEQPVAIDPAPVSISPIPEA